MKKFLAGLLVLIAFTVSMSGCGKQSGGAGTAVTRSAGKQDPFGKYTPEITLTTVRTMSPNDKFEQNDPEKRSYEENRWMRVFKEDLGINVKYNWLAPDSDSAMAKWNANIAAGDIPDFAIVDDNIYKQLYEADYIADMGQILQDYGTEDYLSTITQSDYEMMTMDGKLLGFPGGAKALMGATVLFVRQDWLDKVGLPAPQTIDDVIATARAFRAAKLGGNDTIGLLVGNSVGGPDFVFVDGKLDSFMNAYGAYYNYWVVKDGKLAYGTVQPEMRAALLKLQEMYKEGLINKDFAVVNNPVAREYVASGKAGLWYANGSSVVHSQNTLVKTTPGANPIHVWPPMAVKGKDYPIQTNSPKGHRIFVSNKSKNPEAVVKLATLSYRYKFKDGTYYMEDETGFPYYKFLPWGDTFAPAEDDLLRSDAIRQAELSGSTEPLPDTAWQATYETYKLAKEGKSDPWNLLLYGPKGVFSTVYDKYKAGQLLLEGYNGLPTDTQVLKGGIINAALQAAMFEVIMGADISVWDRAAEKWYADGGTQITSEVNQWYQSLNRK
jgi:putative aldouronate transport system substrate-binding protein